MDRESISFVVPLRGRKDQILGFIYNIKKYYKDFEIIFCNQADDMLFRKGQLSNLGFKKAKFNIIAFINVDYRFLDYVDIVKEMEEHKSPFIPFVKGKRIVEPSLGKYRVVDEEHIPHVGAVGGCQIFTREQFIKSGGHTNLIFGWGPDDVVMSQRISFVFTAHPHVMGHILHGKTGSYVALRGINQLQSFNPPTIPEKDSFEHTIADEIGSKYIESNIVEYSFRNIRVTENFEYMDRYNKQCNYEKKELGL